MRVLIGLVCSVFLVVGSCHVVWGDEQSAGELWSLQAPAPVSLPTVEQESWPRSNIDRFVLAQLEERGLTPTRDASRRAWLRRVYFDLIGLPPTPHEVARFVADEASDALEKVVDRLLASPRFGERWGRHWLDVARFAESSGREFNFTYPHAWPYRNYVIDALNRDVPYDQFVREQIAGDLLPERDDVAARIAVGFLALGPKRHSGNNPEFQMDVVDGQIDTTMRAVMGLTLGCARCHDHKFDPVTTQDYYALAGIFLSTEPLYGTVTQTYSNHPSDLLPFGPEADERHVAFAAHQKEVAKIRKQHEEKNNEFKNAKDEFRAARDALEEAEARKEEDVAAKAALVDQLRARKNKLEVEFEEIGKQLEEMAAKAPISPKYAFSARDRDEPADAHIALGGEASKQGDVVARGFLSNVDVPDAPAVDKSQSGRLQLAHWLTSRRNPLTARVMVNRIWHHLFGRGLVETVDNFGVLGKPPSHPQLLDFLAVDFMEGDWSVKRMIRSIVLCRTYGLSTVSVPQNNAVDPDNRWLWRSSPRRLDAESLRDAILAVSGQLNRTPPEGSTVTTLGDKLLRDIPKDKMHPPNNHRSVYLPVLRDYLPEMFQHFDFPSPSLVTGKRAVTSIPSQSLYLRNSPFVVEQATNTARRVINNGPIGDAERVEYLYQLALSRPPTLEEQQTALGFVRQSRAKLAADVHEAAAADVPSWSAVVQALFASAEFRYLVEVGDGPQTQIAKNLGRGSREP